MYPSKSTVSKPISLLIKIPFIQYLYGIKSMRQTVKEIEVNVAYRWFLGLDMLDKVPHFSTFGKNYTRRFKDTDLFEQIFAHILSECYKFKLVDPNEVFVDATHVKARANNKKMQDNASLCHGHVLSNRKKSTSAPVIKEAHCASTNPPERP